VRTVAVLGPGGVGGFVAGALARSGEPVTVVAREDTAADIARDGLHVDSVRLGAFTVHPAAVAVLEAPADVLVVAVKAPALEAALERVRAAPRLVVPLLNGVEHVERLRQRFATSTVCAASIRIAAERAAPGRIVHTSPIFRIEMAPELEPVEAFAHALRRAEVPAKVLGSEAQVLWTKLARLAALGLTTAASGRTIGEVRAHPRWRMLLQGAVDETAAVARAEGAGVEPGAVLAELASLEGAQTSSLARDVAAGCETELDAIGGAVLRAAARHGIDAPSVAELLRVVGDRLACGGER
jgi:2-dehydropantoate 2-reductase